MADVWNLVTQAIVNRGQFGFLHSLTNLPDYFVYQVSDLDPRDIYPSAWLYLGNQRPVGGATEFCVNQERRVVSRNQFVRWDDPGEVHLYLPVKFAYNTPVTIRVFQLQQ